MEGVEVKPANVGWSGLVRPELDMEEERPRVMLKNLTLDDKKKKPAADEPKEQKTKKVMVRADGDYIKYLKENPPPQPFEPLPYMCSASRESRERYIAQQKAALEEHERILKQYEQYGYADIEFVVNDDSEE